MLKLLMTTVILVALVGTAHARPVPDSLESPSSKLLESLPTEVQKEIEDLRVRCRAFGPKYKTLEEGSSYQPDITSGDGGLVTFMLSGAPAVMVNDQYLCGGECLRGANCTNRNSYSLAVYVRSGKTWRKVLKTDVVGDIFLSTDWVSSGEFRVMVLSVFSGNKDCPTHDVLVREGKEKYVFPAWKQTCDAVVRWDGTKFTFKPLERLR
jgi:hypothetical protein